MSDSRIERWEHLANSLTSFLSPLKGQLDSSTVGIVEEFIENREYGVALEWLIDAISQQSIVLSATQRQELVRLAKLMNIAPNR
ncbi:hypothetical protein V1294_006295 [Bradyrhizobium sp. AZCC 1678]|uniref:MafI family immunity protein n=1 Tax=Bradyrhizobium sp. AZCC 1678 TaxID=3117030 RepID=UPI002FF050B2